MTRLALAVMIPLTLMAQENPVLDRVAVVVGKAVITESEVLEEARITEFLNGQPLDLGPEARRQAADRLVDQQLVRNDMELGGMTETAAPPGDLLRQYQQSNYPSAAEFQQALAKYGITEEQLKRRLEWQARAVRFTEFRFPELPAQATPAQSADRAKPDGDSTPDAQFEAWLKEARSSTKIQFKKEAFQ